MSIASLEKAILAELKQVTGNSKLTKNNISGWSTGPVGVVAGETIVFLPTLRVNVAYAPRKTKR